MGICRIFLMRFFELRFEALNFPLVFYTRNPVSLQELLATNEEEAAPGSPAKGFYPRVASNKNQLSGEIDGNFCEIVDILCASNPGGNSLKKSKKHQNLQSLCFFLSLMVVLHIR